MLVGSVEFDEKKITYLYSAISLKILNFLSINLNVQFYNPKI